MSSERDTIPGPDAAPEGGADRRAEEADPFRELGGEARVDEVLAGFEESTPEEIIALADGDGARAEDDPRAGDEPTFDGFVLEAAPRAAERDRAGEPADELDGLSAEELFSGD